MTQLANRMKVFCTEFVPFQLHTAFHHVAVVFLFDLTVKMNIFMISSNLLLLLVSKCIYYMALRNPNFAMRKPSEIELTPSRKLEGVINKF